MRRTALLLGVSRTTIARKLIYLGKLCAAENDLYIQQFQASIKNIQFDELQTIDHTKCKPLSVAVAVGPFTRKILDIQVSHVAQNVAHVRRGHTVTVLIG